MALVGVCMVSCLTLIMVGVLRVTHLPHGLSERRGASVAPPMSANETLRERYARGEIDLPTLERMTETLERSRGRERP